MRHISELSGIAVHPTLSRYRSDREYWFAMRGVPWRMVLFASILLATPGSLFLVTWPSTLTDPTMILTIVLLSLVLAGLGAQLFKNRVVLSAGGLQIRKDFQVFSLRYADIENVLLADRPEDVLQLPLEEGEYPMEFDAGKPRVVVIVLRRGTLSRSTAAVQNGIPTRYVTFNLFRPERFFAIMRMRV